MPEGPGHPSPWELPGWHSQSAEGQWSDLAKDAWRRGEAEADPVEARRWLERARRMAPTDDTVALSLAAACLRGGDAAAAQALFETLAETTDLAEAWLGLAASALRSGDPTCATAAMQAVLSRHAASPATRALAASVARAAGLPGWCALDEAGVLHAEGSADLAADGVPVAVAWTDGRCQPPPGNALSLTRGGEPLLGSPIDRSTIDRVEGCVATDAGGLSGWAWYPHNPSRDPFLLVGGRRIVATLPADHAGIGRPLARPRRFRVHASEFPAGPVAVTTPDGQMLLGSPVYPMLPIAKLGDAAGPPTMAPDRRRIDVVIPVHGGAATVSRCLQSVLATLPDQAQIHVVDDAGRDPALTAALDQMAADGLIILHRLPENRGFPAAANVGLAAAGDRDVVLLNSDTVVPLGWLAALADAAYGAPDIGSSCPLSNDAGILSYPGRQGGNPMPDAAAMAALARQANGPAVIDIPVAVGFCMFIRHDCLAAVGLLREDAFAQGYGEENDWSLRAGRAGWRHVAVPSCFVAHRGAASFGAAREHLLARNTAVLNRLHPGYDARVAAWIERDPLGPARRQMDTIRWQAAGGTAAVILVTHAGGGGIDRVVFERTDALRAAGIRPVVLRPASGLTAVDDPGAPNLRYRLPAEWDALLHLLRSDRVLRVELHHLLGHPPALLTLAARLGVQQEAFIHDYASLCARINLVAAGSYCGEPPLHACVACVAEHGTHLVSPIGPAALVGQSEAVFAASSRIVVPSVDTAKRLRRHFPTILPVVEPLEDDAATAPPAAPRRQVRHLCIVGAIGVEKGYDVLLGCVRDAAKRRLPLRFTVVGFTSDDARLLAAGPVFITGRYQPGEAEALIRPASGRPGVHPLHLARNLVLRLGEAWRGGLQAAVFDLGAPAERVRRTGWGFVLPLGLPPPAINDWMLRARPAPAPAQLPHRLPPAILPMEPDLQATQRRPNV